MTNANVDVTRAALKALARRDLERLGQFLAEDISWHTPGNNLVSGDFYGREAVLAYLERASELLAGTLRIDPVDFLVGHDHVAAVVDISAERSGRTLKDRAFQVFRLRDCKITMRRLYPFDQRAFDQFWSA